ncbi:Fic family protein [Lactococcus lactis]|uniref:Fic family protein n=1 Tax=Lactococcus lactis TaxID=1358 RepID=UPI0022B8F631|nr:Fic family protein [Lactococcus lactis]MCZ8491669.1 Fic family protein [Lactococcus lactis]
MEYKELRIVQYEDYSKLEEEYTRRISSYGTYVTKLYPYVLKHGETTKSALPLFVVSTIEIQNLMQEIMLNSQKIEQLASEIPQVAQEQYYMEQLSKAIISTNEIEGVHTTRKEVADAIDAIDNKRKEKVRLRSTVLMYMDIMNEDKISINNLNAIRKIYDGLTEGEIVKNDLPDGWIFRNKPVIVGKNYTPPEKESEILEQLNDWVDFINDQSIPFLIKAAVGHFFFENTHPFFDRNGRTGRYIFSRYLSKKLDQFSGLIISQKINESRKKYFLAFEIAELSTNRADATFFVKTMLEFIKEGQEEIISELNVSKQFLDRIDQILGELSIPAIEKGVLHLLHQSFAFTDDVKEGITDNVIIDILHKEGAKKSVIKRTLDSLEDRKEIKLVTQRPKRHQLIHPLVEVIK